MLFSRSSPHSSELVVWPRVTEYIRAGFPLKKCRSFFASNSGKSLWSFYGHFALFPPPSDFPLIVSRWAKAFYLKSKGHPYKYKPFLLQTALISWKKMHCPMININLSFTWKFPKCHCGIGCISSLMKPFYRRNAQILFRRQSCTCYSSFISISSKFHDGSL